jgi:hypothetical protein
MSAFIFALGMTLMHFLWQGLLLGCVTAAALTLLRNSRAEYRYLIACSPCWPACAGLCLTSCSASPWIRKAPTPACVTLNG